LNNSADPAASVAPGIGNKRGLGIGWINGVSESATSWLDVGDTRQTKLNSFIRLHATATNGLSRNWIVGGDESSFAIYPEGTGEGNTNLFYCRVVFKAGHFRS
jgi:hypothetical protein